VDQAVHRHHPPYQHRSDQLPLSENLIQHLKAGERVAVFPEGRLSVTGALMKIYEGPALAADKADAAVLPVYIEGAQYSLLSRLGGIVRRRLLPRIRLTLLPPRRLIADADNHRLRRQQLARQLDELMIELAYAGMNIDQPLPLAMLEAWERHGGRRVVLEDAQGQRAGWRMLFVRAFALAELLETRIAGQNPVGVLLPNANAAVIALLALQLRNRVPVFLNFTMGSDGLLGACRTARIRTICTARAFIATAGLDALLATLRQQVTILYLEDLQPHVTLTLRLRALRQSLWPARSYRNLAGPVRATDPAIILFTSGSERAPKGVVLTHRNVLANVAQARAVFSLIPLDVVLNALPLFHAFGLTIATLTPLLLGARVILYPSPLHYSVIPEIAYERRATILFGTNTFLWGYGRSANPYDFFSVRSVIAGAEVLREETRRLWMEKFGVRIHEGYGLTETSPVLAANSNRHHRNGTVGKLFPGIDYGLDPVEGITDGGLLQVRGANIMAGYLLPERPERLAPPQTERGLGWHDTGDIVRFDSDGFITILGRAKRFAKLGGEMISLAAIEQLAAACWPEDHHTALSLPDALKGESVILLTTRTNADRSELVVAAEREGLSPLHIPRQVLAVSEIPLLGSGKPNYPAIRQLAEGLIDGFPGNEHQALPP
jgi:acyl-[acyl-carrier-protein]-phospholipid O-acyltransferase/long-chain-fatty-acid--[acyl-carrier-protein] ligase